MLFSFHLITLSSLLFSLFAFDFAIFSLALFTFSVLSFALFEIHNSHCSGLHKNDSRIYYQFREVVVFIAMEWPTLPRPPLSFSYLCPTSASHSQRQRRSIKGTRCLPAAPKPDCYGGNQIDPAIASPPPILLSPLLPLAIACKLRL